MKENKYDNDKFFQKYSHFPRSVRGLTAAGEWHEFQRLFPDFEGKRVLDIGCGFGWHCVYAAQHGASYVLGIDLSKKMLAVAKEKNTMRQVEYKQMAMEDMNFSDGVFDIVISSLAFHYTPDFKDICRRVHLFLASGGSFIFSVEHPVFTANGSQEWNYDADGNRNHWPVDHYFTEGKRDTLFLGERVIKYHKTLTTYVNTLLKTGFALTEFIEPQPAQQLLDEVPDIYDELRRPMMLIISARKI